MSSGRAGFSVCECASGARQIARRDALRADLGNMAIVDSRFGRGSLSKSVRGSRIDSLGYRAYTSGATRISVMKNWTPDSWRDKPILQVPKYPEPEKLAEVETTLRNFPPLVFAGEARSLKRNLARVAA